MTQFESVVSAWWKQEDIGEIVNFVFTQKLPRSTKLTRACNSVSVLYFHFWVGVMHWKRRRCNGPLCPPGQSVRRTLWPVLKCLRDALDQGKKFPPPGQSVSLERNQFSVMVHWKTDTFQSVTPVIGKKRVPQIDWHWKSGNPAFSFTWNNRQTLPGTPPGRSVQLQKYGKNMASSRLR